MSCDHRLWDLPDGLPCTRTDKHSTGHVYKPASNLSNENAEDQ